MLLGDTLMYGLPDSTLVHQQLPKKAVYEKFGLSNQDKIKFDQSVHRMTIVAEISPRTLNIQVGDTIKSFFLIEIELQSKTYDKKSIEMLFKLIEQNIILILRTENEYKLAIFKEILIEGDWMSSDVSIPLNGLNLDLVWDNIVINIGNIEIEDEHTLEEQINVDAERLKIQQQIDALDKKMRSEKQPRAKRVLYERIKALKEKLV